MALNEPAIHAAAPRIRLVSVDLQVKPAGDGSKFGGKHVIKIWGRNTSSNVQKVMWAVAEIGLPYERIDIGGPFGQNRAPA